MVDGGSDPVQVDEWSLAESDTVNLGYGIIQSAHDLDEGCVVEPCSEGQVM